MKVFFDDLPVTHMILKNCFSNKVNQNIIKESLKLERKFQNATIGNGKIDSSIRSNHVCYYHDVYPIFNSKLPYKIRDTSPLLFALKKLFSNSHFRQLLTSCPKPFSDFAFTNNDEIQVSRYGNDNQKYEWHIDSFEDLKRQITMVYYFNKEPKKYKGGELLLSKNPIYKGKLVGKKQLIKTIIPENNTLVIFSSNSAHCVKSTSSSSKFEDGRFSANIWVGYNR